MDRETKMAAIIRISCRGSVGQNILASSLVSLPLMPPGEPIGLLSNMEVIKEIGFLKRNIATGPDSLSSSCFKEGDEMLIKLLESI